MIRILAFFLTVALIFQTNANAAEEVFSLPRYETEGIGFWERANRFQLPDDRPHNYIFLPILSLVVPSLGQFIVGQKEAGLIYSGMALTGLAIASHGTDDLRRADFNSEHENSDLVRRRALGLQMYQAAGSFSAYHSFRTAVRTRQPYGQFQFLTKEETFRDLSLAPFQFSYLTRPTTYIPLSIGLALASLAFFEDGSSPLSGTFSDYFYASNYSYLAGTHEEALFRGFMMPAIAQSIGSPFIANLITSGVFAAAHTHLDLPWPQFIGGMYFGWLTQRRQWTLSESIFIHTWWDVILMGSYFAIKRAHGETATLYVPFPSLQLQF